MTRTVLVTGGAGFIGAYVTRRLLAEGRRVVVYDLNPRGNVLDLLLPEHATKGDALIIETGEITDGFRLMSLCRKHEVDSMVHLASPLTMDVVANPATGVRDICQGTHAVFATAREARLRRVVWTSSVAVFGPAEFYPTGPLAEGAFHRPANVYGSAKSLCETMSRQMAERDDLDIVGLRLSVVYGAGRLRGYMSYPSHLMREAAMGTSVHLRFGDQRLHWQYVDEVAGMIWTALISDHQARGHVYNAHGDCRSWRDAAKILRAIRPDLRVTVGDEQDAALLGVVEDYDSSSFKRDYGLSMDWPLELSLPETLQTYATMSDGSLERHR
jgi:UDP-glucose 4-epimerase